MSQENIDNNNIPQDEIDNNHDEEGFINLEEVQEEIIDDDINRQPPNDDDEEDIDMDHDHDHETLEIDMSNNSWTYFDQHKDSIFTVFKHPKFPMVFTGGGDNTGYLWTTHTQPPKLVAEIENHKESVISGGFTHDGKYLVSADMNGFLQVFKSQKGGEKWVKFSELDEVEEITFVTIHPTQLYFAFGSSDGSIWVYQIDETTKSLVQIMSGFSHTLECNAGEFIISKDENELTLITISEDGTVVNWNCFTGQANYKLQPHDDFKGIETPWVTLKQYENLIAIGGRDGQLSIINNDSGKIVVSLKTLENVDDLAELSIEALDWCKNKNINLLAVGLVSGDILLFDTLQWRLRKNLKVDDAITKLEFLNDTPILIGSSMNGKIYKWDSRTGEEIFTGVGHNMGVLDFAILENGKKLVTAGDEGVSLLFLDEK
ncbi:unnamed protein product [Candida verbasci]|uniref:Uncharacterized protein n=1 Tax=Candida verbasci TaxID=1227364 RepID=A0A9W4U0A0_9ASCO|nr:unnamed protein product [Candida verbasci]